MRLSMKPVQRLDTHLEAIQKRDNIDISEYTWKDLGFVCYGVRNNEGYCKVYIKLGTLRDTTRKATLEQRLSKTLKKKASAVEVEERYYVDGAETRGEFSDGGPNNYHHIDTIYYNFSGNLYNIIKMYNNLDTRYNQYDSYSE